MRRYAAVCLFLFLISSISFAGDAEKDATIEVVARDYRFDVSDTIQSGWNTFSFHNEGHTEHFFLLNRLPDSISYETYTGSVPGAFQVVYDSLREGMSREQALALLLEITPGWYFTDVVQMGGTGIISKGLSSDVTLRLPAGTYVMECYIKEGDLFHTTLGMIARVVVTDETSGNTPPDADVALSLTNFAYEVKGELTAGENRVAVHFLEHPELGLGNDVHIIRLDDDVVLDSVIHWLDWMNITGLQSPAPVVFLGGAQEMPVGETAYFSVTLTPGRYALIAESSAARGMVEEFVVK